MFGISKIEEYEIGPMSSWVNENWGDEVFENIIVQTKKQIMKKVRTKSIRRRKK